MNDVTLKDLSSALRGEAADIRKLVVDVLNAMSVIDGKYEDERPENVGTIYTSDVFGDLLSAKHDFREAHFGLVDLAERVRKAGTETAPQEFPVHPASVGLQTVR